MKRMILTAGAFLAFALGCGGVMDKAKEAADDAASADGEEEADGEEAEEEGEEEEGEEEEGEEEEVDEATAAFESASFPCCTPEGVKKIVQECLDLSQALAADDQAKAQGEGMAFNGRVKSAAKDAALSEEARAIATDLQGLLTGSASASLEDLRGKFGDISSKTIELAQAHQGGDLKVAVATCSKVESSWLQSDPEIKNPYLGQEYLGCGSFGD